MNIIISGPFGLGSLADEAILAGLISRLSHGHEITVFTQHPDRVSAAHPDAALKLVALANPSSVLSTPPAWHALAKGHAFIISSAGTISDSGNPPSRVWLSQLEHGRTAGVKTAIVGVGARPAPDARERARIQRFLHNYADGIAVRDDSAKVVTCAYGMSPSRISNNGTPTVALAAQPVKTRPRTGRIGIVLNAHAPTHDDFGFEEMHFSGHVSKPYQALIKALLEDAAQSIVLFHDDTPPAHRFVRDVQASAPDGRIEALSADTSIHVIREQMAGCEVVFSTSLQGMVLATTAGTPTLGLRIETGAIEFLRAALPDGESRALPEAENGDAFDAAFAVKRLADARAASATLRETLQGRLKALLRKEAQNSRMIELLVPRRDRYDRRVEGSSQADDDLDEDEAPPRASAKGARAHGSGARTEQRRKR